MAKETKCVVCKTKYEKAVGHPSEECQGAVNWKLRRAFNEAVSTLEDISLTESSLDEANSRKLKGLIKQLTEVEQVFYTLTQ